jgi:hypothetical protein
MKCGSISIATEDPEGNCSLELFRTRPQAAGRLGQLLIDLIEERVWSNDFVGSGYFSGKGPDRLSIDHPAFLRGRPLVIQATPVSGGRMTLSVEQVEEAVRIHLHQSYVRVAGFVKNLESKRDALFNAANLIAATRLKATIAMAQVFAAQQLATTEGDVCFEWVEWEGHLLRKIHFYVSSAKKNVSVEFGQDKMPAKVLGE